LTLLELMFGMAVLAVGLAGYARTVSMSMVAANASREATLASQAGRQIIESMRSQTYDEIFARYNSSTADDPALGASPGANFAIPGLDAQAGDVDGFPGEISFPVGNGGLDLRESVVDAKLGMPSDLNGDTVIDAANHAGDYQKLPVLVRVRWSGAGGEGQVEFQTVLGSF
jgi:type II secretory pathway pseudopilin PulG